MREYCPSCERYVTGVHSCYDAAQVRALADADRAVVEAAIKFRQAGRGRVCDRAEDLLHATDALLALRRGEEGTRDVVRVIARTRR
jgi:hypothetical protein